MDCSYRTTESRRGILQTNWDAFEKSEPLNDQNVINRLAAAVKNKSKEQEQECLSYMTQFSLEDIPASIHRCFEFYFKWHGSHQQYILEALYSFLKNLPHHEEVLKAYLENQRKEYAQLLITIGLEKGDDQFSLFLINLLNTKNIACSTENIEKALPLLFCLTDRNDLQQIKILGKALEIAHQDNNGNFIIFRKIRDYKVQNTLTHIAEILYAVYAVKSDTLFSAILHSLYDDSLYSCLNSRLKGPKIYEDIHKIYNEEKLRDWAIDLIIQEFKDESVECIAHLLAFMRFYNINTDEKPFLLSLDKAVFNFSYEQKCEFAKFLLSRSSHLQYSPLINSLIKIVTHWGLDQDRSVRKQLISCILSGFSQYNGHLQFDTWLQAIQELPRKNEENPLITILTEYLEDLPKSSSYEVFTLLDLGTSIGYPEFIDCCLNHIDSKQLHALDPGYNYSNLINFGISEIRFNHEWTLSLKSKDDGELVVQIPATLIKMRAPRLLSFDNKKAKNYSFDELKCLFHFIGRPSDLPRLSFQGLGQLALMANDAGAIRLKHKAEAGYLKSHIENDDFPLLLKLFETAHGKHRQELFQIILAEAIRLYEEDKSQAIDLMNKVRDIDPTVLIKIAPYHVLMRLLKGYKKTCDSFYDIRGEVSPLELNPSASVMPWFFASLKKLIPEIQEMDLQNFILGSGSLEMLHDCFPKLQRLTINKFEKTAFLGLERFKNLKNIEMYVGSVNLLSGCFSLPLEVLTIHAFPSGDFYLQQLLKIEPLPPFLNTLKSLAIKGGFHHQCIISDGGADFLFTCPNLREIALGSGKSKDKAYITKKTIEKIDSTFTELTSFAHAIDLSRGEDETIFALKNLIKNHPNLVEFSSFNNFNEKFKETIFPAVMNKLPALKKLSFHYMIEDSMTEELVEKHPDLEVLDLSHCFITGLSVEHLSKLKNLKSLTLINTTLSLHDVFELTAALPELKDLTIKLNGHDLTIKQEHAQIIDWLAHRNIEVTVIDY